MFRGAIIIFTCTASILFLKNKYYRQHFLGICIVVIGLIIVGVNAALGGNNEFDPKIVLGIFLVIFAYFLEIIRNFAPVYDLTMLSIQLKIIKRI